MKITIEENKKDSEIEYPCVKQYLFPGAAHPLVLFWAKNCGMVIQADESKDAYYNKVGFFSNTWNEGKNLWQNIDVKSIKIEF